MESRSGFARAIGQLSLSHVERATAFLWYYRQTQEFEERTASELANDLHDEGFPKPNVTRLKRELGKNRYTVRGRRGGSYQLDVRRISELDERYEQFLRIRRIEVSDVIIPNDWVSGTRPYLERMVYQINGSYEYGFFDGCAVLFRRLMESLLIELYISRNRSHEIQSNGVFVYLDKLIATARADKTLNLGRNTPKTMTEIKQLGDTAAHDRVYITQQQDIDDVKTKYRRMIQDLLTNSGIKK